MHQSLFGPAADMFMSVHSSFGRINESPFAQVQATTEASCPQCHHEVDPFACDYFGERNYGEEFDLQIHTPEAKRRRCDSQGNADGEEGATESTNRVV